VIAFLARRLGQAAVVTFTVATLTFLLIHAAPGSPFAGSDTLHISPDVVAQMRRHFGLDQALPVQYVRYLGNLARGDWGLSFSQHRPVLDVFKDALPNTLLLAAAALLVDFTLGIAIGTAQGMRPGSRLDRAWSAVTLTLYSIPQFWLGLMAILVFGLELHWLPVSGAVDPVLYSLRSPLGKVLDHLRHLVLPALTLGLIGASATARYQRAAILDVVRQDFIRTARAKGLSERAVALRHALRNALLPIVTLFGLAFPILLSGAVLVEYVFSWPGMGKITVDAIAQRDYFVVTGAAILVAFTVVLGNLVADVLTWLVDPRTRQPR
jgi:ABC-type dipeptide/oligopeptide/nickel transport system permease component